MAIGVLLLPDHGSGIPCRPICDNAILSDNSNGFKDLSIRDIGPWRLVTSS